MSIAARAILAATFLTLAPTASSALSIDRLYCNGLMIETTKLPENIWPTEAILNGDHLRLWVERGVASNTEDTKKMVTFDQSWGLGYQLDRSAVAGIVPVGIPHLTMMLSFSGLKVGPHRLRIGLMRPDGQLVDENTLCFTSPGRLTFTER